MPFLGAGALAGGATGAGSGAGLATAGGGVGSAIASAATAVAGIGSQLLLGEGMAAIQARDSAQRAYEQTLASERTSSFRQYGSLLERQAQQREGLALSNNELTRRAGQALSATIAQPGATGNTAFALLADVHRQRLISQGALLEQQQFQERQQAEQSLGIQSQAYQNVLRAFYAIPSKSSVYSGFGKDFMGLGKTGLGIAAVA